MLIRPVDDAVKREMLHVVAVILQLPEGRRMPLLFRLFCCTVDDEVAIMEREVKRQLWE